MGRQRTIEREAWEHAKRHEHELTPNQRRVLDLICEGRTNAQIGEALGMTLDGAKWNVSEALTKLGLATREEAAEFWRSRRRWGHRVGRVMRGLLGVPVAAKVAAGGVALAVVVGAGVLAWLGGEDKQAAEPARVEPFTLEARFTITDSTGTSIAGQPTGNGVLPVTSGLRWWFADRDNARWQVIDAEGAVKFEVVQDARSQTQTIYAGNSNSYSVAPLEPMNELPFRPTGMSVMLGPLGVGTLDEFLDALRVRQTTVEVVGEEKILGRQTVIVRHGPMYRGSSMATRADGSSGTVERESGEIRTWVDPERMVVLKEVATSEAVSYEAEVTSLKWGKRPSDANLAFEPPPGAIEGTGEAEPTVDSSMPGALLPRYLPASPRHNDGSSDWSSDGAWFVEWSFESAEPGRWELIVRERYLGNGEGPELNGEVVLVRGNNATLTWHPGDTASLRWVEGSVAIELESRGLSFEELLKVAEGMRPGP